MFAAKKHLETKDLCTPCFIRGPNDLRCSIRDCPCPYDNHDTSGHYITMKRTRGHKADWSMWKPKWPPSEHVTKFDYQDDVSTSYQSKESECESNGYQSISETSACNHIQTWPEFLIHVIMHCLHSINFVTPEFSFQLMFLWRHLLCLKGTRKMHPSPKEQICKSKLHSALLVTWHHQICIAFSGFCLSGLTDLHSSVLW